MQAGSKQKPSRSRSSRPVEPPPQPSRALGIGRIAMVVALTLVALIVALLVVPPIAREAGLFEKHVDLATAAVAFVIVVIATRWLKSQSRKSPEKK
jgi:hypothetical protein